jgi:Ca-activated chloride channel homolog
MFRFAQPEAFLLLVVLLLAYLLRQRWRKNRPLQMRYSDTRLLHGVPLGYRWQLRGLPDLLRLITLVLLVFAVARPQFGAQRETVRVEGIDIVLAMDISRSMEAQDFAPDNRLQAAKQVIDTFVAGRQYDRIGLLVFARDAYHLVPPTLDYRTLRSVLGDVQLAANLGLPDGTAIGVGLASATNMLVNSEARSRVVILLTDGENTAGQVHPITAAQAVAALDIRVYTIGMGRSGTVLEIDRGEDVVRIETALDEPTLQAIAEVTDGRYYRAQDLEALQAVYQQIDSLETTPIDRNVQTDWRDQPDNLLLLAFILLLFAFLLRRTLLWSALR